ncbi:hypothetical protein [Paenibacillus sp. P46E]|uniref:hypothetical protein n=1 Tax=Paenibacillus sp. P46E TaxID=1349436 RepID=UPI00093D584A|nr:hypothetical protein [Paenibacillus sp. P46E]OKP98063.1 hypothetical protein A3849_11795 [Paenibacillus sp. P46E]
MLSLPELAVFLLDNNCDFELITLETPSLRTQDAEQYFDLAKAVPSYRSTESYPCIHCLRSSPFFKLKDD